MMVWFIGRLERASKQSYSIVVILGFFCKKMPWDQQICIKLAALGGFACS